YPNDGFLYVRKVDGAQPGKKFRYFPGDIPAITDLTQLQTFIYPGGHNWSFQILDVAQIDRTGETITHTSDATIAGNELKANSRYYLQGAREFLDKAGEFYYDPADGYLYYWPFGGAPSAEIYLPKTTEIFSIAGSYNAGTDTVTW